MVPILGWVLAVFVLLQPARTAPASVVAVYEGTLPCADCAGIQTELTILGKSEADLTGATFKLFETYLKTRDGDRPVLSAGRLLVQKGGSGSTAVVYELRPARGKESRYFERINDQELRLLDRNQKPIVSKLPYSLKRKAVIGSFLPATTTSPGIRAVAQFAVAEASRQSGKRLLLQNIVEAERQTTLGNLYRVCIEALAGQTKVRGLAMVSQALNAKMTLQSWTPGGC